MNDTYQSPKRGGARRGEGKTKRGGVGESYNEAGRGGDLIISPKIPRFRIHWKNVLIKDIKT